MTRSRALTGRRGGRGLLEPRDGPGPAAQRGAVTALVVIFLPCLLAAAALVIDVGVLLTARGQMAAAADMGALAGVQDLDYDLLAEGQVVIVPEAAIGDAESWVRQNLASQPFIVPESVSVTVTVLNTGAGGREGKLACPVTGRPLDAPTVCVVARAEVRLPFLPRTTPVSVRVHADASLVGRP